jgi:DNA-binding NarL/FixJ family response regulator
MVRILIADSRPEVRAALRLLVETEPDLDCSGEAADAIELLRLAAVREPEVALVDWRLPGLPAHQLVRLLRCERPDVTVIAMSGRSEDRRAAQAAGVDMFIYKGDMPRALGGVLRTSGLKAIRSNREGKAYPPKDG